MATHILSRTALVRANGRIDHTGISLGSATDDGEVFLFEAAFLELPAQGCVGRRVLGHQHDAAGFAVEAMAEPGGNPVVEV
jgi:hypothetical protein